MICLDSSNVRIIWNKVSGWSWPQGAVYKHGAYNSLTVAVMKVICLDSSNVRIFRNKVSDWSWPPREPFAGVLLTEMYVIISCKPLKWKWHTWAFTKLEKPVIKVTCLDVPNVWTILNGMELTIEREAYRHAGEWVIKFDGIFGKPASSI